MTIHYSTNSILQDVQASCHVKGTLLPYMITTASVCWTGMGRTCDKWAPPPPPARQEILDYRCLTSSVETMAAKLVYHTSQGYSPAESSSVLEMVNLFV